MLEEVWVRLHILSPVHGQGERTRFSKEGKDGRVVQVTKKSYLGVRTKLFLRAIHCANPRPDPGYQSNSGYRRVLGR